MFEKSLGLLTFSQDEISSWILTYTLPSAVGTQWHKYVLNISEFTMGQD